MLTTFMLLFNVIPSLADSYIMITAYITYHVFYLYVILFLYSFTN